MELIKEILGVMIIVGVVVQIYGWISIRGINKQIEECLREIEENNKEIEKIEKARAKRKRNFINKQIKQTN